LYSLKSLNTFGIDASAEKVSFIQSEGQLQELILSETGPFAIIGGGSNILFTRHLDRHLLVNRIKGIKKISEDDQEVVIKVGGGEVWHDLVLWAIEHNYGGLENLSLIPGTVGAAPIQNIGAYGVEQESIFHSLKALHLETGEAKEFLEEDCAFGYRDSIFKRTLKGKYFITEVNYRLQKKHQLNLSYGAIKKELENRNIINPKIKDVSSVVIDIRQSKLPDPAKIGNCGSFFKNPVISMDTYQELIKKYPGIPSYPIDKNSVKIPAGWLIDKGGWKGFRKNQVGTHQRQALVIINHGGASGLEIWEFAKELIEKVDKKYSIRLEPEVNIW
jgi:UDP-N-acetylmuramate dehydrogenase